LPGFPIGRSTDRSLIGSSPWLIAAVHVLHRHLAPRHPPLALCSLGDLFFCLRVKNARAHSAVLKGHAGPRCDPEVGGGVPGALAATAAMATAGSSALPWRDTDTPASRRTDGAGEVRTPSKRNSDARSYGVRWCLSPFPKGSWERVQGSN
jgi:hypothetical protein